MNKLLLLAIIVGASAPLPAWSVVVNEKVFEANGGNLNDIPGTIALANEPLRQVSYSYKNVGSITGGCTATWLGHKDGYAYILTAAHCHSHTSLATPSQTSFTVWDGSVAASGEGTFFVHPYRLNIPAEMGGASTDIGVLKIPFIQEPQGALPVLLYDGTQELNKRVDFVGYGYWGVGKQSNGAWSSASGDRRLWGQSIVSDIFEADHGIAAGYQPSDFTESWALQVPGDSGSAWWQDHDGYRTVIATASSRWEAGSNGARVSKYVGWIKDLYPDALSLGDVTTVTRTQPFVSPNYAEYAKEGMVYYVVPQQANARGPQTSIDWSFADVPSKIYVTAKEVITQKEHEVVLRATRATGCSPTEGPPAQIQMNEAASCRPRQGPLTVAFHTEDNPHLPHGRYRGKFHVTAKGFQDLKYTQDLPINIDIQRLDVGQVTESAGFTSMNYASLASSGSVYYTVPQQANAKIAQNHTLPQVNAKSPQAGLWSGATVPSKIYVTAKEAITQKEYEVVLRATRITACYPAEVQMNDAAICASRPREGPVTIRYYAEDNTALPEGMYRATFVVQANGWHDLSFRVPLEVSMTIDKTPLL